MSKTFLHRITGSMSTVLHRQYLAHTHTQKVTINRVKNKLWFGIFLFQRLCKLFKAWADKCFIFKKKRKKGRCTKLCTKLACNDDTTAVYCQGSAFAYSESCAKRQNCGKIQPNVATLSLPKLGKNKASHLGYVTWWITDQCLKKRERE